jgi:uncharacterized Fe-S cluster-containing protein
MEVIVAVQNIAEEVNKISENVELVFDELLNMKKICAKIVVKNLGDNTECEEKINLLGFVCRINGGT